jgi:hypothetical protein
MKTRTDPHLINSAIAHLEVEVQGTPHHFRIPSPLAMSKLLKSIEGQALGTLIQAARLEAGQEVEGLEGLTMDDPQAMLAFAAAGGMELMTAAAALWGLAWNHKSLDLETPANRNLVTYGDAVYEELHEKGYTLSEIFQVALGIHARSREQWALAEGVWEKVRFFAPTAGSNGSHTSASPTATPETPSPGTA